jgi:dienelactone hydrolase
MPHAIRPTLLIAADIFGLTPELGLLAQTFDADTTVVSPHPCATAFRTEAEGYAAFMARGGVAAYAKHIGATLSASQTVFDLALGFSAGASALWLCLADAGLEPWLPTRAELYYGSRIRDHADLEPRRHVRLIFAEREASFDPSALARLLCARGRNAEVLPGSAHGFMNPLSAGYDHGLAGREAQRIKALLAASRTVAG